MDNVDGRHTNRETLARDKATDRFGESSGPSLQNWHILLFVLAATFTAYARTLSFGFVHDDFVFLVNNPAIHSWRYLSQYFTSSVWEGVYPGLAGNYYRPVFLIWMRLQDALFGSQAGLWHLTTVGTHLAATVLAYYLALRILRDRLAAATATMVFGLHPVHIEAVAWISGVTEPLVGVFFLGAFLCYLKMRDGGGKARVWLMAAVLLYIIGLLEKETEILLPAIIGVYEWVYGALPARVRVWRTWWTRAWRAISAAGPFILVTLPYLVVRVVVLKGFSHVATNLPLKYILDTWPLLIWFWIRHLVVPVGLGTFYDLRTVVHPGWEDFYLPLAGTVVVAGLLVWGASRSRAIAFSAAWMILPLLPFFDLRMFNRNNFAQDRFLYLPSLGLAMIVGLVFQQVRTRHSNRSGNGVTAVLAMISLALLLGFGIWKESFYFENNWIFYRYNYLLAPRNAFAENDYGEILVLLGMKDEAVKVLQQSTADDPGYRSPAYNLGCLYYQEGKLELAQQFLSKAIRINPALSDAYFCLGLTELKAGNPKQAEQEFRAALRINPKGKEYHYELGLTLMALNEPQAALAEFENELAVNPRHPEARRLAREMRASTQNREPVEKSGTDKQPAPQ
jgi:protein O-mannosyl-transferase